MLFHVLAFSWLWVRESLRVGGRRMRGQRLRPGWSAWLELLTRVLKADALRLSALPPAQRRAWQDVLAGPTRLRGLARRDAPVAGVECVHLTHPGGAPERPLLVYLHGGAMLGGSFTTHADLIVRLALASGLDVVMPAYRLAPEHTYPAGHDDCAAVVRALQSDGRAMVLAGDSAGGTLAVAMCLRARSDGSPQPLRLGLICPWSDLRDEAPSRRGNAPFDWAEPGDFAAWSETYRAGRDANLPELSIVRADLAGLPPMLVQYGTAEMLHDEVKALCERARASGVVVTERPYADMVHNWHFFAPWGIQASKDAIAEQGAFLAGPSTSASGLRSG